MRTKIAIVLALTLVILSAGPVWAQQTDDERMMNCFGRCDATPGHGAPGFENCLAACRMTDGAHIPDPNTWSLPVPLPPPVGVQPVVMPRPYTANPANLLDNPSFEGDYYPFHGIGNLQVAESWGAMWWPRGELPLWAVSGGSDGPIRRPEYKPLPLEVDSGRVRTGERSQAFFTFYGVLLGGVYQTVPVPADSFLQASVWAQTWTSAFDDPSQSTGEMYVTVCVDPAGGTDPWARRVQCADWQAPSYERGEFRIVASPVVQAEGARVTVFILAHHKWSIKHGDMYIDDAALVVTDASGECPTCPECPACPPCEPGTTEPVDYDRIADIFRDVWREMWPGVGGGEPEDNE